MSPRLPALLLTAGLALSLCAAPILAHPELARHPVNHVMKSPGARSSWRLPLSTRPVKYYLPLKGGAPSGAGTSIFQGLLRFYRNTISPVDGNRCAMAPTCSLYSHQAIQEHGVLMGIFLTADRLLHEGDEIARVPRLKENGETLFLDPLEANTYWWWDWLK